MLGLGWPELLVIALVGFFVFGPERLPTLARDAARILKQLRAMADGATADIRAQLPSAAEFGLDEVRSLRDLHPKTLVSRALFDSDEPPDLMGDRAPVVAAAASPATAAAGGGVVPASAGALQGGALTASAPGRALLRVPGAPPPYDLDAT